jgi:hypothetical protein
MPTPVFGYAIGDFVAVGQLAWNVVKRCLESSEQFHSVSQDVRSLRAIL